MEYNFEEAYLAVLDYMKDVALKKLILKTTYTNIKVGNTGYIVVRNPPTRSCFDRFES